MPEHVVSRVSESLCEDGKSLDGAVVLIVGVAYKPNVDDIREAPSAEIIKLLTERGAEVKFHDPHISSFPSMRRYRIELDSVPLDEAELSEADCALIITDHDGIDWGLIGRHSSLVVDTRNAMVNVKRDAGDCVARVVKA